ncbi:hypothetical protein FA95DRAFT_1128558 [Auriscalpium vulgare]|uniref:Uncharacterized protein n=1 Tax=Auriscalpium vulgare TaxID=40419 RepID=A0ACB8R449_9AGAM|nr:hypothetical protein FA95DRAFT_1128558 [Auriscalpium vulgare]
MRRLPTLPSSSSDGMLHPVSLINTGITDFPSYSFALPTLGDGVTLRNILFAEESPVRLSTPMDQTSGAFSTDPAERLLCVVVFSSLPADSLPADSLPAESLADPSRIYERWELCIPARKLLHYVAEPATTMVVPWAVWGRDARLDCWPMSGCVSVSGMRKVGVHADRVVISDFNPYRIRVARGGTQEAGRMTIGHSIPGAELSHAQCAVTTSDELGIGSGMVYSVCLTDDCLIFMIDGDVSGTWTKWTKVFILERPSS